MHGLAKLPILPESAIRGLPAPTELFTPGLRRFYAFTLAGDDPATCAPIEIIDHGGETQPVSNDCRKYLYQLHFYDIPYSFIAAGREAIDRRLTLFPTVEVACAADRPHANLPYQSLLTAPIRRNPNYRPQ